MMKKTWKKALASMLTFAMVLSSFSGLAVNVSAAEAGEVSAAKSGNSVEIGNEYISREFSVANNKLSTVEITNKRTDGGDTVFTPASGSEEFIIRTTKAPVPGLDKSGWEAYADSYQDATIGSNDGPPAHLIDGDPTTIWHSAYNGSGAVTTNPIQGMPYNIVIDLGEATEFQSVGYTGRSNGANGRINGYEIYIYNGDGAVLGFNDAKWGTAVKTGNLENSSSAQYINLDSKVTATQIRIKVTSSYGEGQQQNLFGSGAEIDLYADVQNAGGDDREFAASDLTLTNTEIEDTDAVINDIEKSGKKITFTFAPYTYKGVEYTINEVIVMYDGDHFMRKYMEISVPEAQQTAAEIDYIDLESLKVNASDAQWTIPTDAGGVVAMDQFKANLGQPIYIQGMFFGCEFPAADNQIVDGTGYMRYYTGKDFAQFEQDNQLTTDGKYVTWQTVAGAARSTEQQVIQADFFEYIKTIATPSDFRIQYNSWFDNMMHISDENILNSFIEVDKELNTAETRPLDSYVVDDGWINYNDTHVLDASRTGTTLNQTGFWEFNSKFPDGLTPSSELVHKFGSNFGVWVGPRGGYNFYGSLADILTKSGKGSKAGNSIDVADREYIKNLTEMFVKWQKEYGVNYWKWDGFADQGQYNAFSAADGVPGYANRHMTGGYQHMYHVTDLWEGWISLMKAVRASEKEDGINNLWISLTCYVNPSPWYLQWANSVWMQCVYDQKDAGFGTTKMNKQLTYRDTMYYDFIVNHEFQFPLSNVYNHDPIYGKEGTGMTISTATDDDFKNYLYMQSTRGTSFWELYYSDSIMTPGKYEVTGEFLEWAEENYHMLRNSKYIGGSPDNTLLSNGSSSEAAAQAYGFSCFDGTDGILSMRNPSASSNKTITFTFDRTIGVAENAGTLKYHLEHTFNLTNGTAETGELVYGQEYSFTLRPNEVRILRVSADGDTTAPQLLRAFTDGDKEITVRFDEKVKGTGFAVAGAEIASVEQSADDITYRITLTEALADGATAEITTTDVTDLAGNACADSIVVTHHKDNVVATGAVAADKSLNTNYGFTVVADVASAEASAVVAQGDAYELGINADGKAYFTVNGSTAVSGAVVNDGDKIVGVKENNGILKLYVAGTLEGAVYNEANRYYEVEKANITVSDQASAVTVYDKAFGYDEVADLGAPAVIENLALNKSITGKWTADNTNVAVNSDMPLANAVDGTVSTGSYADFGTDDRAESVYLQIDLGQLSEVTKLNLYRYWSDGRTYEGTVIALSETEDFAEPIIVYNSDTTGELHGLGAGEDATYAESENGLEVVLDESVNAQYVRVYMHGRANNAGNTNHVAEIQVWGYDEPKTEPVLEPDDDSRDIPVAVLTATTGDYEKNGGASEGPADLVLDGNGNTLWHTDWYGTSRENHWIQFELSEGYVVDGLRYQPRQSGNDNGIITEYQILVSDDGENFELVTSGTWEANKEWKIATFEGVQAKYVRLVAVNATTDNAYVFASAGEIRLTGEKGEDVVTPTPTTTPEPTGTPEPTVTPGDFLFNDVQDDQQFYYGPVYWAYDNNITTGVTPTTFQPDANCTRGQIITFIWRAMGKPEVTNAEHSFTDVDDEQFYYDAMLWGVEAGVINGLTETTFAPDANCTRGQIVTMLWRAQGKPEVTNKEHSFTDVDDEQFYYEPMLWAVENGITTGKSATTFEPDSNVLRGETVTFLYRVYKEAE